MNAWVETAAALVVALLVSACTSLPQSAPRSDALSGRLSVRIEPDAGNQARSVSASFELRGTSEAGQLDLATPLGTVMAQARWEPNEVVLTTPDAKTAYPNLEALARAVLGESLPLAALFDWLRGRPWPGAPSEPRPSGFEQLGWVVGLSGFDEGWVSAERAAPPAVTVRARIDR